MPLDRGFPADARLIARRPREARRQRNVAAPAPPRPRDGPLGAQDCPTQSRSNPVSRRCLRKTGIFQISAGDYRQFRSRSSQFRSLETDSQFGKARHWRAFPRLLRVKSPGAALPGWRRSADRAGLHANSLLTGNFTGKFAISRC